MFLNVLKSERLHFKTCYTTYFWVANDCTNVTAIVCGKENLKVCLVMLKSVIFNKH